MHRLDRARLDAAVFPVSLEIQTRFDDLDLNRHVNNAAAVVILQEARVDFNRRAGLWEIAQDLRMMAVGLIVEFAGELQYPDPVEVLSATARIGRSSYALAQIVRQLGRTAIYAEATMVFADSEGPTPVPEAIRARLSAMQLA